MSAIDQYQNEAQSHKGFVEFIGGAETIKAEMYGNDGVQLTFRAAGKGGVYNRRVVGLLLQYLREHTTEIVTSLLKISSMRVLAAKQEALDEAVKFIQGSGATE